MLFACPTPIFSLLSFLCLLPCISVQVKLCPVSGIDLTAQVSTAFSLLSTDPKDHKREKSRNCFNTTEALETFLTRLCEYMFLTTGA